MNFCKFTNETRNGIEDSSAHSGLKFIAACNGSTAGGGYELALACDEIILVDDRSSAVSLPEVPLLGVLPGTGGLTRLTDKRHVRRDLGRCVLHNVPEGMQGQRAKEWGLVDAVIKPQEFDAYVSSRARELAELSDRPGDAPGVDARPRFREQWTNAAITTDTSMWNWMRSAEPQRFQCRRRNRAARRRFQRSWRRGPHGGPCRCRGNSMTRFFRCAPTSSIWACGF